MLDLNFSSQLIKICVINRIYNNVVSQLSSCVRLLGPKFDYELLRSVVLTIQSLWTVIWRFRFEPINVNWHIYQ